MSLGQTLDYTGRGSVVQFSTQLLVKLVDFFSSMAVVHESFAASL